MARIVFAIALLFHLHLPFCKAQIVGSEAFLQGDFLEIGMSECGAYGSAGAPPSVGAAGTPYHPTSPGLGFVADADADGWSSSWPPYCGDYFLPGSPVEGFSLSIDAVRYNNSNGFGICGSQDISGNLHDYQTGDTLSISWSGSHPDGFDISIRTYFPRDKQYFIGQVTLTNTGSDPLREIYFTRQVDPDNDQPWSGSFSTLNAIESQPGAASQDALVSATGSLGCYLGLGARHFAARASRGGFYLQDPKDNFCGISPYEISGADSSDHSIAISFYFAEIAAGDSVQFQYAFVLEASQLEEALSATEVPDILIDGLPQSELDLLVCEEDSFWVEIQDLPNWDWSWTPEYAFADADALATWYYPHLAEQSSLSSPMPCGDSLHIPLQVKFHDVLENWRGLDTTLCPGTHLNWDSGLEGMSSYTWSPQWFSEDTTQPFLDLILDTTEASLSWTLEIMDSMGCSASADVLVQVPSYPQIILVDSVVAPQATWISLTASGAAGYQWLDNPLSGASFQHWVSDSQWLFVDAWNDPACIVSDSVWITPAQLPEVLAANAFTPDDDGLNDCFGIHMPGDFLLIDFRIFNRWGELLFFSEDPATCWDGTFRGKKQPIGSYVLLISYVGDGGLVNTRSSTLTLLR
jgi:gliding motility-associated-like protein